MTEDFVAQAMKSAGVTLDERRLMPLAQAREHLSTVSTFGDWRAHAAREDRTWAALISLADGAEFVREASRFTWVGSPRSMFNVSPHQRYGDAIAPWLLQFVDRTAKTIRDTPWCVGPCLALIRGPEIFSAVLETDRLETTSYVFGSWEKLIAAMIDLEPAARWPMLATRALADSPVDVARWKPVLKGRSDDALSNVEMALGLEVCERFKKTFKLRRSPQRLRKGQ